MKKENAVKKWLFWFGLAVAIIVVYNVLGNFTKVTDWISGLLKTLMPFIIGILIAYLLYIPCRKVESLCKKTKKRNFINKHARGISITIVYIVSAIVVVILINVIMPSVVESLSELVTNIPNYYNSMVEKINELPEDNILRTEQAQSVINNIKNIDWNSLINLQRLQQYLQSAMTAVRTVMDVCIAFIVSIYILAQRKEIVGFLAKFTHAIFNEETYYKIKKCFNNGNEVFFKFLTSQIIDAMIVGILVAIGLSILNVKYAVLLGFIIGLFNLIPYFGAIIGVGISILITIFTGGITKAAIMAVTIIILQQIDANVINPKIIGDSLNISPLLVIFAVTIGGAYFGMLGMFLGVPVVTVIKMLLEEFIEEKELEKATENKNTVDFEEKNILK